MDLIEFLTWFYGWFFAAVIPAVLFVCIYNHFEAKK